MKFHNLNPYTVASIPSNQSSQMQLFQVPMQYINFIISVYFTSLTENVTIQFDFKNPEIHDMTKATNALIIRLSFLLCIL